MKAGEAQEWLEPQQLVDRFLPATEPLTVLDAGCGSTAHARFPAQARVVGLDISREQLEHNDSLHERIVADLQTYELPAESFNVILCWYVLEHLDDPPAALRRLIGALAPGGVLILACPNPRSIKGLLTRFTPHSVHVWFYKRLLRDEHAGEEGYAPFRTVMSGSIAPGALRRLAAAHGLTVELETPHNIASNARRHPSRVGMRNLGRALDALTTTLRFVTLGRYRGDLSEYSYVLRRAG